MKLEKKLVTKLETKLETNLLLKMQKEIERLKQIRQEKESKMKFAIVLAELLRARAKNKETEEKGKKKY